MALGLALLLPQLQARGAASAPQSAQGFDPWAMATGWLKSHGSLGFLALGGLAFAGYVLSQAQNWEALLRLLGRGPKAPERPPATRNETHVLNCPVITGGTFIAERDLVIGEKDEHTHLPAPPKPEPESSEKHISSGTQQVHTETDYLYCLGDEKNKLDNPDVIKVDGDYVFRQKRDIPERTLSDTCFQESLVTYVTRSVYFATDRKLTGDTSPFRIFGYQRSEALNYGLCEVSIPKKHRLGSLETHCLWKLEFSNDPNKHFALLRTIVKTMDIFYKEVAEIIERSEKESAFIFVHGYNVKFEDAARRTAQIAYDLGFDGASIFYSWPSRGRFDCYTIDEQSVQWSQRNLYVFLQDFLDKTNAHNIYLIAHSMGNRSLASAITKLLNEQPSMRERIKEVILTAPDIDAQVFIEQIAPQLTAAGTPITLYASSADIALKASKKVHGSPRAGDSSEGLIIIPGIETIDATKVDTSLIGHSYFAEAKSVLSDIFYIINDGKRAYQRFGLSAVATKAGCYWEFKA